MIILYLTRTSPLLLFKQCFLALGTGFSTSSSLTTLPVTMNNLTQRSNISKPIVSLFISIGTTINMNGTALYQIIAVLFSANIFNITLTFENMMLILLTTLIVSMGTSAIPGGGVMTLIIILQIANIPIEAIGYILIIDQFCDQCRTTVNIWGNICGAKLIHQLNKAHTN